MRLPGGALSLTLRAIESRAAALHNALDLAVACGVRAGGAFAPINGEAMLEFAKRAVGSRIVAQARAAGLNRRSQHRTNGANERRSAFAADRRRHALR